MTQSKNLSVKLLLFKGLAIITGCIIALFAAELSYRVWLYVFYNTYSGTLDYGVISEPIYQFNEQHGYNYPPDTSFLSIGISNGRLAYCWEGYINEYGNIGQEKAYAHWDEAEMKILVFGDSFTAMTCGPDGSITWTDYLPEHLSHAIHKSVSVLNFGRDSYGMLQMFHLAAAQIESYQPDRILIAFITDDLLRARFWRTIRMIDGTSRILNTDLPTERPHPKNSIETTILHPQLTKAWCDKNPAEQEPFLAELKAEYKKIVSSRLADVLFSINISFLWDKILYNDPFQRAIPYRKLRITFNDYREDSQFLADADALRNSQIPLHLIHLPTLDELRAGKYIMDVRHLLLLKSLTAITGVNILNFSREIQQAPQDIDQFFLLPYDTHPNRKGAELYAQWIAGKISQDMSP